MSTLLLQPENPPVCPIYPAVSIYSPFTTEILIPFHPNRNNSILPFTDTVKIDITIGGGPTAKSLTPTIDTGTCGYIISTERLPHWPPENLTAYPVGWEYLSSSKRLYSGRWIPHDIYYNTSSGVEAKANLPILAVENRTTCSNYDRTTGTNSCPIPASGVPAEVTHLPTGISLFGVGFGRQVDGQPQGDPDKNPFLNLKTIDGADITSSETFRNGYIITKDGIIIGLTERNTAEMVFTNLKHGIRDHNEYPLDWAPVPACIAVDGIPCVNGTALIDTGIPHSYLTLPMYQPDGAITPVHRHTATSPSTGANVQVLDDGSHVQIRFGNGADEVDDDYHVVNSTLYEIRDQTPDMVITTLADPTKRPPFVNTGRHFLRAWEVGFDAVGGRYGFRRAQKAVLNESFLFPYE